MENMRKVTMNIPGSILRRVDEWRSTNAAYRDVRLTRTAAVRVLLSRALQSDGG